MAQEPSYACTAIYFIILGYMIGLNAILGYWLVNYQLHEVAAHYWQVIGTN